MGPFSPRKETRKELMYLLIDPTLPSYVKSTERHYDMS